jgi:hypothetical protein
MMAPPRREIWNFTASPIVTSSLAGMNSEVSSTKGAKADTKSSRDPHFVETLQTRTPPPALADADAGGGNPAGV